VSGDLKTIREEPSDVGSNSGGSKKPFRTKAGKNPETLEGNPSALEGQRAALTVEFEG
jgi:hypothetical protein